jgi:Transposase IS116/IS110/IS902 family./Transposase.
MAIRTTTESSKGKRLSRKQRKELGRQIWSGSPGLEVVHRDAAGIDIGSRQHYVAVGPDRASQPVRVFECFTTDLHRLAAWLTECRIRTVVMQSTGVYWIPVYDVLEQHGFDVWLVNARDTRNLPGRKSDVQESQWLLKLHTYGLLRKSFRPTPEIRAVRTCWRERAEYVQQAGTCIQRMQKALTEMNIQVATVLSDLSGVTGMNIVRAIVAGERDGMRLAEFREPGVKASKETIAKSLEGTWLPEQLAILKRQLVDWDHVQKQMAACDLDLQTLLKQMPAAEVAAAPEPPDTGNATTGKSAAGKRKRKPKKKASKNEPNFDLVAELKRVAGVDLTRIDGIKAMTVQTIVTEAGLDMSKWPTEHHFVSWIGFAPRNEVSSGKVLNKKTRKVKSRLATALRTAASTLRESESYLGAQFRRLRARLGPPKAITAMGAKLARLVYRMLKYGQQYVDKGTALYEENHRQQQIRLLTKKAAQHGFTLVPSTNPA